MKKILLLGSFAFLFSNISKAQLADDSASIGAGYTNQAWYSLDNGTVSTNASADWDMGFQINGFSAPILFNTANGAELYIYPNGDTSAWSTMDTTGMSSWTATYNDDKSWNRGAFNGTLSSDPFDLGWGKYNQVTHYVTGDSLYIAKMANGQIKKIWIEQLAGGKYYFKVADLNGSNMVNKVLTKAHFTGKNFGYYSIANDSIIDIEPMSNSWDLVFTKYTTFIPTPYGVSGIVQNIGVEAVKVYPVNDVSTYQNYSNHTFNTDFATIGYDWKSFDFATFSYLIDDSTVYFVKTQDSAVWKVVMTGFGGSGNGNFYFSKQKLTTTSIQENTAQNGQFYIYPNPAKAEGTISIVADMPLGISNAQLSVISMNGQLVSEENIQINSSFDQHQISIPRLQTGVYFIRLTHSKGAVTEKLIVQ